MPFADPEKRRQSRRKYAAAHREQFREYNRKCNAAHLKQRRAASKKYREERPDDAKATQKKYREANREKLREASKRRAQEHPEWNRASQKKYRTANREKIRIDYAARRARPAYRMKVLVQEAMRRAVKRGLDFDEGLIIGFESDPPMQCKCCHVALDYSVGKGVGMGNTPRSPSLDRIDNTKGYTVQNTAVICYRCNAMKGAATIQDAENLLAYMRAHQQPAP